MILSYAFKRIIRSWKLFTALLLGTMLAATFFAGINIGADTSAKQALNQQLSTITVDAYSSGGYNTDPSSSRTYGLSSQNWTSVKGLLKSVSGVAEAEMISRPYLSLQVKNETGSYYFYVTGIEGESRVYDGLTVTGGSTSLGANETYVVLGSKDQDKLKLGGNASFRIR